MSWSVRNEFVPGVDRGVNCSVCHSDLRTALDGSKEQAVTTGELIEMEGLFTICETCIGEAAALIGWIEPVKAKSYVLKNRELGAENARLRQRQEVLEQIKALV